MKILFIYPAIHESYPLQIAALSAYLKRGGHSVRCLILDVSRGLDDTHLQRVGHEIQEYAPGLAAFSCYEPGFEVIAEVAAFIKSRSSVPIIFGGYYPSIAPEEVMTCAAADFLCRAEGEEPLLELCNALEKGTDYGGIQNLWVRRPDRIIRNPVRPLIEDIDSLPYVDREIIDFQSYLNRGEIGERKLEIMVGRGCPYHCTYCINTSLRDLHPNKHKYLRVRSVSSIISEIQELRKRYDFNVIGFNDDNMTAYGVWLEEFCTRYKAEIGLPFFCASRVETCTEKIVKRLKDAGCYLIHLGVESGDEAFRKKYLNRKMSNKDIIHAFRLVKRYGMNVWAYCMIGMPFETRTSLLKTIILNFRLLPAITMSSIYYPLRGTELGDACHTNGWIDFDKKRKVLGIAFDTVIKHPNLTDFEIKAAKWMNVASAFTNRLFWRSFFSRVFTFIRKSFE